MLIKTKPFQRHKRDLKDSIEDTILLLYLLHKADGKIVGENDQLEARVKLMKLVFLSELKMLEAKEKGFNFFYNIYKIGPCSREVYAILDDLEKVDLITSDHKKNSINITDRGRDFILNFLKDQNSRTKSCNKHIFEKIDKVVKEYSGLTVDELLEKVYAMEIETPYEKKINIGEAVERFEETKTKEKPCLLMRMPDSNYKRHLIVSSEWVETTSVLCNPRFKEIVDSCYV